MAIQSSYALRRRGLIFLSFFLANYVAHAATVKALPGERTKDLAFAVLLAITFPFSGITRGLEAIIRHASLYHNANDLQTAARAGALCIVVRNERWICRPSDVNYPKYGMETLEISDTHPRKDIKGKHINADETGGTLSVQDPLYLKVMPFKGKHKLEYVNSRKVHGLPQLPEGNSLPQGYRLALLPSNTEVVSDVASDRKKIILSSSYNIPQVIVAIAQVLYASYTLYKTRGDQLNRYGYAAFGLTVIPYIIMSFVNLLGNLLTPDYPALYLVSSPELKEAISRSAQICAFDGVVGRVSGASWDRSGYEWFIGQYKSQDIPECSRFKTANGQLYQGYKRSNFGGFLWWGFAAFILGAIPYMVIGSLTHFRAAQSTQAQRVLTMFWLASGIFIGATIPFYGFSLLEIIDITRGVLNSEKTVIAKREREEREWEERERELKKIEMERELKKIEIGKEEKERKEREGEREERKIERGLKKIQMECEEIEWESKKRKIEWEEIERELKRREIEWEERKRKEREKERKEWEKERKEREKERKEWEKERKERKERIKERERERVIFMFIFLSSLVFCASAIGGFIIVGQMLKDYGSCILLS